MSDHFSKFRNDFAAFNDEKKKAVLQSGCEQAVAIWEDHTGGRTIEYSQDDARLVLDTQLPKRSFDEAVRKMSGLPSRRAGAIVKEWEGPMEAINNKILTFPENVVAAYHAIHHLFILVFQPDETSTEDSVLNQIFASRPENDDDLPSWWNRLIADAG